MSNLVVYETTTGQVELNNQIVRQVIAKGDGITDAEIYSFMKLCQYRKLNPFLGEAHLVKFGGKCSQIVGLSVFQKRLNNHPLNEGFELGVITVDDKRVLHEREGTFFPSDDEKLLGAYIILHKKGSKPLKWTVSLNDYMKMVTDKKTQKLRPQGQWQTMPAVMITKCCFVAGVRYYYPEKFAGMYSADEMGIDENEVIEIVETINEKQIEDLRVASKDEKYKYDDEKLIEYIINTLVDREVLESASIEDIPKNMFEKVKKMIIDAKTIKINKIIQEEKEKEDSKIKDEIKEAKKSPDPEALKDVLIKKEEAEEKKKKTSTRKKKDDNKEVKTDNGEQSKSK